MEPFKALAFRGTGLTTKHTEVVSEAGLYAIETSMGMLGELDGTGFVIVDFTFDRALTFRSKEVAHLVAKEFEAYIEKHNSVMMN